MYYVYLDITENEGMPSVIFRDLNKDWVNEWMTFPISQ